MSRLYTYWVNQKIPKEYRLTPDNKTAMRYYIIAVAIAVAIAFALGVVYGFLANNEQLPMISSDYYSFLGSGLKSMLNPTIVNIMKHQLKCFEMVF
ncbi:Uncharacterised protein [Moraxella caprae]|uniref:Uncharacterized protein n=1 Tax=Moraxella caprae TaxID=90240 RepID=A0A378R1K1_9GAMM|nr:hypothetical protein [Moraxella caprae]STZ09064.1 Uncharacterised protein [Moraxella caprae]